MENYDDLMRKRYLLFESYPNQEFEVGEILYAEKDGHVRVYGDVGSYIFYPKEYPKLFREMGWWENREVEDMPKYLKRFDSNSLMKINDEKEPEIHEVKNHFRAFDSDEWRFGDKDAFVSTWNGRSYNYHMFVPATKEEFEASFKTI